MKKNLYVTLMIALLLNTTAIAQTTQKCNCVNCTSTIDSIVNTPVVVPNNSTLCIGPNGVLNGLLTMGQSSKVCNSGTIKGNIDMKMYSTICNDGTIDIDSMHQDLFVGITNYGNIIIKKDINPLKTEYIKNYGCMTFKGDVQSEGFGSPVWGGKMFIDGDWYMLSNSSELVTIDGYVEVKGTLTVDGTSRLAINAGRCLKAGYVNLKKGYIDGNGPGYAGIEIRNGSGPATGGSYTGMLDVCLNYAPGTKPVAKSFDPTVTFCANKQNCTYSRCDSVTTSCAIAASAVAIHPTCTPGSTGQVTASVTGGTPPYSYSWSNGQTTATITGLAPGTYTVIVSYAGGGACTAKAVATVNSPTNCGCTIDATAATTSPYCNPKPANPYGSITVTASGGTQPYTYSWSSGHTTASVTGLKSGTYTVTVREASGACVVVKSYYIDPSPNSPLMYKSNDTLYALPKQNGNLNLYRWFLNGSLIVGANLDYYVVKQSGAYSVNVSTDLTSENSCTGVSNVINVTVTGIADKAEKNLLVRVIPNPSNGVFSIYFDTEKTAEVNIDIYDVMGKQLVKTQGTVTQHDKMEVDLTGYATGLYFLDIKDKQGARVMVKIIRE